jgi:hypothetical protein
MTKPSHGATDAADPCCPPPEEILEHEASHYLSHAAEDCDEAARRLHWLANGERLEHGLEPDQWLSPAQCARLLRLATLADVLAAEARAVLGEVVA